MFFDNRPAELANLRKLGLPSVFEQIWAGEGPQWLHVFWKKPDHFFRVARGYTPFAAFFPLLESSGGEVLLYDTAHDVFVMYCYEDLAPQTIGRSYQQVVAFILMEFGMAGLEEKIMELVPFLRFKYLDELYAFLDSDYTCDNDDPDPFKSRRLFLEKIGTMETT